MPSGEDKESGEEEQKEERNQRIDEKETGMNTTHLKFANRFKLELTVLFSSCSFVHVKCSNNRVAHSLAK